MAERRETGDPNDRPIPPFTRKKGHVKNMKVFALLVGIDDYQGGSI